MFTFTHYRAIGLAGYQNASTQGEKGKFNLNKVRHSLPGGLERCHLKTRYSQPKTQACEGHRD